MFRQHYERFSKIFRKSKVLRHFRSYFANPNHPEFWEPFGTFRIIGKFSEPFRDFGIFLHMAGHTRWVPLFSVTKPHSIMATVTTMILLLTQQLVVRGEPYFFFLGSDNDSFHSNYRSRKPKTRLHDYEMGEGHILLPNTLSPFKFSELGRSK